MFFRRIITLSVLSLLLLLAPASAETTPQGAVDVIKTFYNAVDAQEYPTAWSLLSEASKARIVGMVAEEAEMPVPDIRAMFDNTTDDIRDGFWKSFRDGEQTKLILSLDLKYAGQKDGFHIVSATMPAEEGGNGQTLEILIKDENGPKLGLAETFQF